MRYHTTLSYDAGLDRLINGEEYGPFQHLLTKASLMSARRAGALFEAIKEYGKAYDAHYGPGEPGARPYPSAFAGIRLAEFPVEEHGRPRIISIRELFALDELSAAPPEYFELVNLVCIVGGRSLALEGVPPLSSQAMTSFARELYRLIYCAHHCCGSALSYGPGTCLVEDFVTAAGWCTDFYFLTSMEGESAPTIFSARCRDLVDGFTLIARRADSPEALVDGLEQALETYLSRKMTPGNRISRLIHEMAGARELAHQKNLIQVAELVLSSEVDS